MTHIFDLSRRTALVTGSGSGLGREMAAALAGAGCEVIGVDINESGGKETAELVQRAGGESSFQHCDVSDADQVDDLSTRLCDSSVDILINNAGISTASKKVHEIPTDEWDHVISVNLRSAFLITKAFVTRMLERPGPSIINISSVVGPYALRPSLLSQASYAASKAGLLGLTRQTAADYGAQGLRANAIAPGWLLGTGLGLSAGNWTDRQSRRALEGQIDDGTVLGRAGDPSEISGLAVYLASDAASYVTGQVFVVDGGWTTW